MAGDEAEARPDVDEQGARALWPVAANENAAGPVTNDEDTNAALAARPWLAGALRFPVGLPSDRTPLAWPVATNALSPSWPVADNVLDLLESLTMSNPERSPRPELEPARAKEKAELAGRMFRQKSPLASYSDA